jgi:hypothetical protein
MIRLATVIAAIALLAISKAHIAQSASTLQPSISNNHVVVENVPTVVASPDYSTSEVMGGKQEIANVVEQAKAAARIVGVTLANAAAIAGVDTDVLFFKQDPSNSTFTEGAAIDVADADLAKLIGVVPLRTHVNFASGSISQPAAKPEMHFIVPTGTSIWAVIVARGTINLGATNDIKLKVDIERQ